LKQPKPKRKTPPVEKLKITIDRLNDDGLGSALHEDKELLVCGAYPGELVEVEILHRGQRRLIGRLLRVLRHSPQRRTSPCHHAADCQGCPLIELQPQQQLEFKRQQVATALRLNGLDDIEVPEVIAAPKNLGYRTTAKLAIGRWRRQLRIGLYRRGSHEIVDIGDCPLHHPLINKVVAALRNEIERQKLSIWDSRQGDGLLRYLLVRVSPNLNKVLVTLVTGRRDYRELTHLAKWLQRKVPEVVAVHQNVNSSAGNVILGRETLKMVGAPDLRDTLGEFTVHIGPTSFLQVNHDQAARLYKLVTEWLDPREEEEALDLYCGIGGIALHLAQKGAEVTGVEVIEEAVHYAGQNARRNGLGNCRFIAGDTGEVLGELVAEMPSGTPVVVNPPRTGCTTEVLEQLATLKPGRLVYVSCNPQTLARDLSLLRKLGLSVEKIQPFDMFPQTPHVETVALLTPKTFRPSEKIREKK
jgi:23S rRNA (uracil1939-C5)-methyltransferase